MLAQRVDYQLHARCILELHLVGDAVKIGAECQSINSRLVSYVLCVPYDIRYGQHAGLIGCLDPHEYVTEIESGNAACLAQYTQLIVGQIAGMAAQVACIGVGGEKRLFGV